MFPAGGTDMLKWHWLAEELAPMVILQVTCIILDFPTINHPIYLPSTIVCPSSCWLLLSTFCSPLCFVGRGGVNSGVGVGVGFNSNSNSGVGVWVGVDIQETCRSWSWSWNSRSWSLSWSWYSRDLPELELELELKLPELELELELKLSGVGIRVEILSSLYIYRFKYYLKHITLKLCPSYYAY